MSRRKRYAAIGLALAAVAVPTTAAVALPRDSTVKGAAASAAFLADHDKVKLDEKCLYPPQKTPHLDLTVDDKDRRVSKNDRVKLTAHVWVNDCDIKKFPVGLYQKVDGQTQFTNVQSGDTNKFGEITFTSDKLKKTTSFYVVTPGGFGFDSQQSRTITITVR